MDLALFFILDINTEKIIEKCVEKCVETANHYTTIKILKKGVFSNCSNWRGITLLSVSSKLFYIIQRKASAVGTLTRYLFSIRIIIEQCSEWQRSLYINLTDFHKAFDSKHRDSLWRILRASGILTHAVKILQLF